MKIKDNNTKRIIEHIKNDILKVVDYANEIHGVRNPHMGSGVKSIEYDYPVEYYWTDSFFVGELWLAYMITGKNKFKNSARMRREHFENILNEPLWHSHDLGFLFSLYSVADYKLTGDTYAKQISLNASNALKCRFNDAGQYIMAWTPTRNNRDHAEEVQDKIIIDCMENLPLLLWAYKQTGVESYKRIAIAQADTSLKYLVRDDWSSFHTFDFDPKTNRPLGGKKRQGYSDTSCWCRGQAWAIHGFAQMALYTGDSKYLEATINLSDYALKHMPDDFVPLWDYHLPKNEIQYKDTSAGAVTSAGLFILADILEKNNRLEEATKYHDMAIKILLALRNNFDITQVEFSQGLLSCGSSNVNIGVKKNNPQMCNSMLPYGDYYYFEAVLRALGHKQFFW